MLTWLLRAWTGDKSVSFPIMQFWRRPAELSCGVWLCRLLNEDLLHSVQIGFHNTGTLFYLIVASLLAPNVSRDRRCSNFAVSRRPRVSVNIAFSLTLFNECTGNVCLRDVVRWSNIPV